MRPKYSKIAKIAASVYNLFAITIKLGDETHFTTRLKPPSSRPEVAPYGATIIYTRVIGPNKIPRRSRLITNPLPPSPLPPLPPPPPLGRIERENSLAGRTCSPSSRSASAHVSPASLSGNFVWTGASPAREFNARDPREFAISRHAPRLSREMNYRLD